MAEAVIIGGPGARRPEVEATKRIIDMITPVFMYRIPKWQKSIAENVLANVKRKVEAADPEMQEEMYIALLEIDKIIEEELKLCPRRSEPGKNPRT